MITGDGDHGQGMVLGSSRALRAAEEAHQSGAAAARTVLRRAGDGWSESAGGTSGALWGSALTAVRAVLSDQHGADDGEIVQTVRAGAGAVLRLGGAQLGDKPMVDALIHFADTLRSSFAPGNPLAQVWLQTAGATTEAAAQTAQITAGLGRAKTHGDCHADPGATSFRPADEPQQRRTAGQKIPSSAARRATPRLLTVVAPHRVERS